MKDFNNTPNPLKIQLPIEDLIVRPHCQDWAEAIHTIARARNETLPETVDATRCRIKKVFDAYRYANVF